MDPNVEKGLRVWRHLSGRVSLYDTDPQELPNGYRDHNRDHNRKLRRPDATIFIRNIPDETTEEDMRALFEPHGLKTNNKVISITINHDRAFAFVDFDGSECISAIVKEATTSIVKDPRSGRKIKSAFMVHGRVLEVERKVPKQRKQTNKQGRNSKSNRENQR